MRMLSVGYLSVDCLSLLIVAHQGRGWLRRQAPTTLRINPTKQGYCPHSRFLQQAFFGLRFGLRLLGGASGRPPYGGIVHKPDLRLGFGNRQVDGFGFAGG